MPKEMTIKSYNETINIRIDRNRYPEIALNIVRNGDFLNDMLIWLTPEQVIELSEALLAEVELVKQQEGMI